jgi:hypothetical protein
MKIKTRSINKMKSASVAMPPPLAEDDIRYGQKYNPASHVHKSGSKQSLHRIQDLASIITYRSRTQHQPS